MNRKPSSLVQNQRCRTRVFLGKTFGRRREAEQGGYHSDRHTVYRPPRHHRGRMVGEAAGAVAPHVWDLREQKIVTRPIVVENGVEEAEILEIEV